MINNNGNDLAFESVTMRDWFAGQAIASFLALGGPPLTDTARDAYEVADAMIAERSKGESQ